MSATAPLPGELVSAKPVPRKHGDSIPVTVRLSRSSARQLMALANKVRVPQGRVIEIAIGIYEKSLDAALAEARRILGS